MEYLIGYLVVGVVLAELCRRVMVRRGDSAGAMKIYLNCLLLWPIVLTTMFISGGSDEDPQ